MIKRLRTLPLGLALVAVASFGLAACTYTFNEGAFETFDVQNALVISDNLSFVEDLGEAHIQPDTTPDFWEIRIAGDNGYQTIGMGGSKAFSELPAATAEAVQSLELMEGAPIFCGDGPRFACYVYIISVTGDAIEVVSNADELVHFLGTIDTPSEAALVAMADNYYFSDGWIRQDSARYTVLATAIEKGQPWECTPGSVKLTTYQVLLEIGELGRIDVVARKHLEDRCVDF